MPTYDYECDNCRRTFDRFELIDAEPLKRCPRCGRLRLRRLIGAGGAVIFKGSGFHQTDYRSEEYKRAARADEDPKT